MRTFHYWRPTRRTRPCDAADCPHREQIRTDAITVNGRIHMSLCARHWTDYRDRSGLTFTEGRP